MPSHRLIAAFAAAMAAITCHHGTELRTPVTVRVAAAAGWQPVGRSVRPGQSVLVTYAGGVIRDRDAVIRDGNGSDYVCGAADCCEPLPNQRRSALIGRIGSALFPIGNRGQIASAEGGEISLRINDCDEGLFDNSGNLEVRLEPATR